MTDEQVLKDKHIFSMKEAIEFFGNKNKLQREIWVVKHLLSAFEIKHEDNEVNEAEEPADVKFRDALFQVKELFPEGRKRNSEYKEKLKKAQEAEKDEELLFKESPSTISFTEIVELCSDYSKMLINSNKYGIKERNNIDLLFYFNYVECTEVPPESYVFNVEGFRSISVVGSRYCSVLMVTKNAPEFLKNNLGNIITSIDT